MNEEQKPEEVKRPTITQRELILRSLPDSTLISLAKIYEEVAKEINEKKKEKE